MKIMEAANAIFKCAREAVSPTILIRKALKIDGDQLTILENGSNFRLHRNVYVAAFGKAAAGMSRAVEDMFGEHIVAGVASIPYGSMNVYRQQRLIDFLPRENTVIRYHEGAVNNFPDENANVAAMDIKCMVEKLTSDDILLVLISGGGSALLPCPIPEVTVQEKSELVKFLSRRGADISELNTVRQHLSQLKGGKLAELGANARAIISLIISDIIGNDMQFIASGPTCIPTTTPSDAAEIIRRFSNGAVDEEQKFERLAVLLENLPKYNHASNTIFQKVYNVLIGSSATALEAAFLEAKSLGFRPQIIDDSLTGEASETGRKIAHFLGDFLSKIPGEDAEDAPAKKCWIWGGETVVCVKGRGRGGRNQEMVLAFALEAQKMQLPQMAQFAFLSCGTDGQDGPTDAAGAVVDSCTLSSWNGEILDFAHKALDQNDSYTFFQTYRNGYCHIKCGLTGTNVMDVQVLLLDG